MSRLSDILKPHIFHKKDVRWLTQSASIQESFRLFCGVSNQSNNRAAPQSKEGAIDIVLVASTPASRDTQTTKIKNRIRTP
jgi:hypothetical protein